MKLRAIISEALGTLLLLATIVGSGIMAERLSGGNQAIALLGNTIPTGAILVVLILVFGPPANVLAFIGAQLLGAGTAAALFRWLHPASPAARG